MITATFFFCVVGLSCETIERPMVEDTVSCRHKSLHTCGVIVNRGAIRSPPVPKKGMLQRGPCRTNLRFNTTAYFSKTVYYHLRCSITKIELNTTLFFL